MTSAFATFERVSAELLCRYKREKVSTVLLFGELVLNVLNRMLVDCVSVSMATALVPSVFDGDLIIKKNEGVNSCLNLFQIV